MYETWGLLSVTRTQMKSYQVIHYLREALIFQILNARLCDNLHIHTFEVHRHTPNKLLDAHLQYFPRAITLVQVFLLQAAKAITGIWSDIPALLEIDIRVVMFVQNA